jgi:hypothetical protein
MGTVNGYAARIGGAALACVGTVGIGDDGENLATIVDNVVQRRFDMVRPESGLGTRCCGLRHGELPVVRLQFRCRGGAMVQLYGQRPSIDCCGALVCFWARTDLSDDHVRLRVARKRAWARAILPSNNLRRPAYSLEKAYAYQVLDKLQPNCKTQPYEDTRRPVGDSGPPALKADGLRGCH